MKQYDDCAEIENSLTLYVGGDLEAPAMDEVARHLAACPACTAHEKQARSARDTLVAALVMSERRGPELWPGVRAGLVREGVLQPQMELTQPRAARRPRLVPYAAAAAALLIGFWLARDAFDTEAPVRPGPDQPPNLVERGVEPAPPLVVPGLPKKDALRLVGRHEPRLREGAEIYSDLGHVLGTNDEHWITPVADRH
jgi:anti-sigma factor RsiW